MAWLIALLAAFGRLSESRAYAVVRSAGVSLVQLAWPVVIAGAAVGLGMSLYKGTGAQRRNALTGGALGGALGGLFFDPIDRFLTGSSMFEGGDLSRLVGLIAVGDATNAAAASQIKHPGKAKKVFADLFTQLGTVAASN